MQTVVVHEIDHNKAGDYMVKRICLNNPRPRDMFKEIHSEFTRQEKKDAKQLNKILCK